MSVNDYRAGEPCWIGLGTADAAKAAEFYGALLGWDCPEGPPEHGGFRTCLLAGTPVGGMGTTRGDAPQGWRTYFNVRDIEETVAKAVAAGGSVILPATDVADAGRLAVLSDDQGAPFGLWQPIAFAGISVKDVPGSFAWCELISDSVEQSAAFYGAVFGWELGTPSPDDASGRAEWLIDGQAVAGVMPRPAAMPAEMRPYWDVFFQVDDIEATVATASSAGATVLLPSLDIKHGTIAVFLDPIGAIFSVVKPNA
jgi:predicted enzyme related to lactoylglutathione lyase